MRTKLLSRAALFARRRAWGRAGKTVVFTNGCFDLLHPGHVRLLRSARALGDVLVLGLNTDASVRRLKGPSRPVQDQRARAELVSALEPVTAVVLFAEDTPARLIEGLRPDVLVKGADYAPGAIVGRRHAGRVARVRLAKGHSTSAIIKRIRGR